jgi:hypothetical protein
MGISGGQRQAERGQKGVAMSQWVEVEREQTDDVMQFFAAGTPAKGEYHCSDCGYGVTVFRQLPVCPMCACKTWEQASWSPFARATH